MRTDIYTKTALTVIAIMLTVIAAKTLLSPETTASAQGPFAGVQANAGYSFFDTRSGELWFYNDGYSLQPRKYSNAQLAAKYRVAKLGQPLTLEYQAK